MCSERECDISRDDLHVLDGQNLKLRCVSGAGKPHATVRCLKVPTYPPALCVFQLLFGSGQRLSAQCTGSIRLCSSGGRPLGTRSRPGPGPETSMEAAAVAGAGQARFPASWTPPQHSRQIPSMSLTLWPALAPESLTSCPTAASCSSSATTTLTSATLLPSPSAATTSASQTRWTPACSMLRGPTVRSSWQTRTSPLRASRPGSRMFTTPY